jgi:hypothetical protein
MTFAITLIASAMLAAVYAVSISVDTSPHRDDDDGMAGDDWAPSPLDPGREPARLTHALDRSVLEAYQAERWSGAELSRRCARVDRKLPAMKQAEGHWQDAEELLTRASIAPSAKDEVLAAVVRALRVEGLI